MDLTTIRKWTISSLVFSFTFTVLASDLPRDVVPVEPPTQLAPNQVAARLVEASNFIRAQDARVTFNVDGSGLTVAVLDTGLRTTHLDFSGKVIAQRNFTADNGGNAENASDGHGHGTNVGGIIVANSKHTGIAPGASIIPLKVLSNSGSGSFSSILDALNWVIANRNTYNISVVNMSLGDGGNYQNLNGDSIRTAIQALRNARVAVVIAAGNSFYEKNSAQGMGYPAIFPESVSVGAVYDNNVGSFSYGSGAKAFSTGPGRITPFSQRLHDSINSSNRTDVFAPGAPITSSGIGSDSGSSTQHGTSQATPVTAGVILLLQQHYKRATGQLPTVAELEDWMRSGSVSINDGDDEDDNVTNTGLNFLRVDALGALQATGIAPGETQQPQQPQAPVIATHPSDMTVPLGETASFMVSATGSGLTYQWRKNGSAIDGAQVATYTISAVTSADDGAEFDCVVTNGAGNSTSNSARLTINNNGALPLTSGVSRNDYAPLNTYRHFYIMVPANALSLEVKTTNASADVDIYVRKSALPNLNDWDYRPYTGSGNETVIVNSVSSVPLSGGIWYCSVRGYAAGSFTLTATLTLPTPNRAPQIFSAPSYNPNPARAGDQVAFSVAAADADGDNLTYLWNFGDGNTGTGSSPRYTYQTPGTYLVEVIVSDDELSTGAQLQVEVLESADPLQISVLQLKLAFNRSGRDAIRLDGSFELPTGTPLQNQNILLNVGGAEANFKMNANGKTRSSSGLFRMQTGIQNKFSAKLARGTWSSNWVDEGMTNEDVRNRKVKVLVSVQFGSHLFMAERELFYSARLNKSGSAQ